MKAKDVMRIGRSGAARPSAASKTEALLVFRFGELHDQDRVLAARPMSTINPIWA